MSNKMSKSINEIVISLQNKLKMIKPFDSIIVFILMMGYFDFGVFQCVNVNMELDKNVNLEIGQFVPILFH